MGRKCKDNDCGKITITAMGRKQIEQSFKICSYYVFDKLREATRETETSSSCVDAIFGNVPLLKSTIEKKTFSDHYRLH